MADPNVMPGDLIVRGTATLNGANLPQSCVGNTQFRGSDPLSTTNAYHRFKKTLAQDNGSSVSSQRRVVHQAYADGTVVGVRAGVITAAIGTDTATVDVKKNGTTILSSVITIDSTVTALTSASGTISVSSYSANDVFDVTITPVHSSGTLPQGVFVELVFDEKPV